MEPVTVAAMQVAPVFLDREATTEKAVSLIREAAAGGARLIAFPEAFVPAYPDWAWRSAPGREVSARWYARLFDEAVTIPGPTVERLAEAAREADAYVVMGINEQERGTLYNTVVWFDPQGHIALKHRKLMPTGAERLVWGMGDGSTLTVLDTPIGRLGGLICWENYMPLARYALYAQGIDIYVAPTWDNSDAWVPTLRHIAKEGRCHVVGVTFCLRGSDVPADLEGRDELYGGDEDWLAKGNSCVIGPEGDVLAGPLVGEAGIVMADVDVAAARRSRRLFDPVGHYARPDIFRLDVDRRPRPPATFDDRAIDGTSRE